MCVVRGGLANQKKEEDFRTRDLTALESSSSLGDRGSDEGRQGGRLYAISREKGGIREKDRRTRMLGKKAQTDIV